MKCQNCHRELACSCEVVMGMDGKSCCKKCVADHNNEVRRLAKEKYRGKFNANRRFIV